jgi:polyisoprenoid-binding protein YceI
MLRRLLFLGLPAVVLIAIAAGAGWWFLIREDNRLADAAPAIPEDLRSNNTPAATTPAGATPGATSVPASAGGFAILADRSEAAYFADEKLASLPIPSTAKGATNQITGQFHLQEAGLDPSKESKFVVDLRRLTSNESRRDQRVQEALQTSRFPNATFVAKSLSGPVASLNPSTDTELKLTGMLEIRGVQKEVTWDVKAKRDGNVVTALATVNFKFAEFGVPVPNIAGFVSVEDDVTLQIQITAQQS